MNQKFFEIGKEASRNLLDSIKKDTHLLLLYEDTQKALKIQLDFIKQGLQKNEICIFAMPFKINIKKEMIKQGIDVNRLDEEKKLYIFPVNNTIENSEPITNFKDFSNKILSITKDKVRICAMLDFDLSTKEGMKSFISAETTSHENFQSFSGSWLCSYNIQKIENKEKMAWIKKLFACHDSVIIAPLNDSEVAFEIN